MTNDITLKIYLLTLLVNLHYALKLLDKCDNVSSNEINALMRKMKYILLTLSYIYIYKNNFQY